MSTNLRKIAIRMSKYAIYAFIGCHSLLLAFATESDAQRKYLADITVQLSESRNNIHLLDLIFELETKTEFQFAYSKSQLRDIQVSLTGGNWNLSDLLTEISAQSKISVKRVNEVIALNLVNKTAELPQLSDLISIQHTVSGTITDEAGEPLPGVTIQIKGTTQGTITDFNGKFSLELPSQESILIISFVGYLSQEVVVGNQSALYISLLPDVKSLEEVVVVGYGTQKKLDVTGSVSSIKSQDIARSPAPNLANSLSGRLTGVITTQVSGEPGQDEGGAFLIRGQSTFGDNSPLILVDGIERPFRRVNPNEIESITVLKDAASTAIYGSRAANGVILITTKRGSAGKATITYGTSISFDSPTVRPEFMNAGEYAENLNIARENIGDNPRYTDEQVEAFKNGTAPNTDWWSEIVNKNGITKKHDISVSGGNNKTKHFTSFGYLNQQGLLELSSFKSYSLRSNIDNDVSSNLKVSLDLSARKTEKTQPPSGSANVLLRVDQSKPTYQAYFPELGDNVLGWNGQAGNGIGMANESGYRKDDNDAFQGTLTTTLNVPFVKGLSLIGRASFDYYVDAYKKLTKPYTYYSQDEITGEFTKFQSTPKTDLTQQKGQSQTSTLQFRTLYNNTWGKHTVSALGLVERIDVASDYLNAYREGFVSPQLDQLFAGSTTNLNNGGAAQESARIGYVGRINYNYDDRYLLQVNARYDGSFNFPKGKRYGFFPAFSAGWLISEESFMTNVSILTNLKLRASWGQVGNDRIVDANGNPLYFNYLSNFGFNGGHVVGGNYQTGVAVSSPANPDVTWETATSFNLGLDFGLLEQKLSGEIDYFKKRTKDILRPNTGSIPETFGSTLPFENIGVVDNQGIEIALKYRNFIGDLNYTIGGNATYAKNEVISFGEPKDVEDRIRKTGRPLNQYYGYISEGLFQSQEEINGWADQDGTGNQSIAPGDIKYRDINDDGVVNSYDITRIGKSDIPELVYGFTMGANYKGFDLNIFFQGASGFQRNVVVVPFELETNSERVLIDSWSPDNTDAEYPRLTAGGLTNNNGRSSTFWLKNATYLRLKNVELAYTLQDLKILNDIGLESARLFISATNFLTFSQIENRDPEVNSGIRGASYPNVKSFIMGLNINF
ncbi:MAG: TonB-dependent receptor [Marinoscillum sp.]